MHNLFYIHSYELKINTIWLMKVCKEGRVKVTGNLQSVLRLSCHFVPCLEPFSKWRKTTNCGIDSYLSAGRDQYDLKHFLPHLNSTHSTLTSAGNQDQCWPCFFLLKNLEKKNHAALDRLRVYAMTQLYFEHVAMQLASISRVYLQSSLNDSFLLRLLMKFISLSILQSKDVFTKCILGF